MRRVRDVVTVCVEEQIRVLPGLISLPGYRVDHRDQSAPKLSARAVKRHLVSALRLLPAPRGLALRLLQFGLRPELIAALLLLLFGASDVVSATGRRQLFARVRVLEVHADCVLVRRNLMAQGADVHGNLMALRAVVLAILNRWPHQLKRFLLTLKASAQACQVRLGVAVGLLQCGKPPPCTLVVIVHAVVIDGVDGVPVANHPALAVCADSAEADGALCEAVLLYWSPAVCGLRVLHVAFLLDQVDTVGAPAGHSSGPVEWRPNHLPDFVE